MTEPGSIFNLRDYEKRDFISLFNLDRLCFEPGIAYSRPELASFIEQRPAATIVAEWNLPGEESSATDGLRPEDPEAAAKPAAARTASGSRPGAERPPIARPPIARPPIAGFVTLHFHRQGYGHIITIDVHPDARRHRLGTLLINAVCERLRKMTAFMVVLEVAVNNHSALAFYDKLGFKRVKVLERYYSRDLDAIFMTKRL